MNRRKHIRKRSSAEDDDDGDDGDAPLVLQPTEKRAKVTGVSTTALLEGRGVAAAPPRVELPESSRPGLQVNAASRRQKDALEAEMEEFIRKGLEQEFAPSEGEDDDGAELTKGPSVDEELHAVPEHMEGTATVDVVIPGFNTVITEFKLGADAALKSIEAAEAAKKALLKQAAASSQPAAVPIKLPKGKQPRPEPAIPRSAFPRAFGRQRAPKDGSTGQLSHAQGGPSKPSR